MTHCDMVLREGKWQYVILQLKFLNGSSLTYPEPDIKAVWSFSHHSKGMTIFGSWRQDKRKIINFHINCSSYVHFCELLKKEEKGETFHLPLLQGFEKVPV